MSKLKKILDELLKNTWVYFYTIDNLFKKVVIFWWEYIIEFSFINNWNNIVKRWRYLYFYVRKFSDIFNVYNFVHSTEEIDFKGVNYVIANILKYEEIIYKLFENENNIFFQKTFKKIKLDKKVLFILKWWWMEETIEKSFISFCNNSWIDLTVLYKYWTWYWWQKLNQDGFFNELKSNNTNVKFIYNENFDDNYIDNLIDENTETFSFQYDYKWKNNNLNMIILSSVSDDEIDCSKYKNIFSCYLSNTIWYSTDKFINTENTDIYKVFNPQNIDLLNNFNILKKSQDFILSWWMSWARDFSILNALNWKYKGILISDEVHDVNNFLSMYRWIQSYYWFLGVFKLCDFWVFCHLDKFNNDDRSKMIATCICAWKPVIIPYNDWLIVKEILNNKLWLVYNNWDKKDFLDKVKFFSEDNTNLDRYSLNCLEYSNKKMDVNSFINFIFSKIF